MNADAQEAQSCHVMTFLHRKALDFFSWKAENFHNPTS